MNAYSLSLLLYLGVLIAGFVMSLLTWLSAKNHAKSTLLTAEDAASANTTQNEALAQFILFCILLLLGVPALPAFLIASNS